MNIKNLKAIFYAILAALLFGINAPLSKLLIDKISPTLMASLLYFGAGFGMLIVNSISRINNKERNNHITKDLWIYVILMVGLDIVAPIFLMLGLSQTSSANVSLISNFEIVTTSIIALLIFGETISKRLWLAITLITISSLILSIENIESLSFSIGSIYIILACLSWGFENNCTKKLSAKSPFEIVIIKGFGASFGCFIIAYISGITYDKYIYLILAIFLGFVSYGLSIFFYVMAQRYLGAAKTSSFYAFAPFVGTGLSFIIFKINPNLNFIFSLIIMIIGSYFASFDYHKHKHTHEEITHEHYHLHNDNHHFHKHDELIVGGHCHIHTHNKLTHSHKHDFDLHHTHKH